MFFQKFRKQSAVLFAHLNSGHLSLRHSALIQEGADGQQVKQPTPPDVPSIRALQGAGVPHFAAADPSPAVHCPPTG